MKTKLVPATVMLLGCSVAVVCTYINGYTLEEMVKVLFVALLLFLILGYIIKIIIDKNIPYVEENEDAVADEGAVIEKSGDSDELTEETEDGMVVTEGETTEEVE